MAGYVFTDAIEPVTIVAHNRTTQGSYSAIRHEGRPGYEWWVTLLGDAAHPTSPYAAYGAGRSIEDGYFLAAELEQVDVRDGADVRTALQAFEDRRKQHTAQVSQMAWMTGIMFHCLPRWLNPVRDIVFDHTPLLQKVIGEAAPGQILSQLSQIDAVEARRARRTTTAAT